MTHAHRNDFDLNVLTGAPDIADTEITTHPSVLKKVVISWANITTAGFLNLRTTSASGQVMFTFQLFGSGSVETDLNIYFPSGIYLEGVASGDAIAGSGLSVVTFRADAATEFKRFSNDDSGSFR